MKQKNEEITARIILGATLKIKYNGGSQPETIREILPVNINEDKRLLIAKYLKANKSFYLDKLEIVDDDTPVTYDVNYEPPKPPTLKELYNTCKEKWEQSGWVVKTGEIYYTDHADSEKMIEIFGYGMTERHINYDKFGVNGEDIIELYTRFKNGKLRKHPTIYISYKNSEQDSIEYRGHTYKKQNVAIQKFLEDIDNFHF